MSTQALETNILCIVIYISDRELNFSFSCGFFFCFAVRVCTLIASRVLWTLCLRAREPKRKHTTNVKVEHVYLAWRRNRTIVFWLLYTHQFGVQQPRRDSTRHAMNSLTSHLAAPSLTMLLFRNFIIFYSVYFCHIDLSHRVRRVYFYGDAFNEFKITNAKVRAEDFLLTMKNKTRMVSWNWIHRTCVLSFQALNVCVALYCI